MLEQYLNITGKSDSLFTLIIYKLNLSDIKKEIKKRIEKIKNISNSFKRKLLITRLNSFLLYIDNTYKMENINSIFLISDDIIEIKLSDKRINTLSEYNIMNFIFKYDSKFYISYINNLFNNFKFANVLNVKNNVLFHILLNSTKKKIIYENKLTKSNEPEEIEKYIQQQQKDFIINGNSSYIKKISENNVIYRNSKNISDNEIMEIFNNYEDKKNQVLLETYTNNLCDPSIKEKIFYGNFEDYILPEIELYKVDKLFYHTSCKGVISKIDISYLNFDLYEIHTIKKKDTGYLLLNNYGGFFGLKYY